MGKKVYTVRVYKLNSWCIHAGFFCLPYYECGVVNAAQVPGTTQDHLQVFNIETKTKMKSYQMNQQVGICE